MDWNLITEKVKAFGALMAETARNDSVDAVFRGFLLTRKLEASVKKAKEDLRGVLLERIRLDGYLDSKGSRHLDFAEDGRATRTMRVASAPNLKAVRSLLRDRGVPEEKVVTEKITVTKIVNPSALEALVDIGVLTRGDVETCYEKTYALNVTLSAKAAEALEE